MKFTKKPVVVEATQWFKNGDHPLDHSDKAHIGIENDEVRVFSPEHRKANDWEGDVVRRYRDPSCDGETVCKHCGQTMHVHGWIETLEGGHIVCPGDWIITGVKGEHYPCKPDIFEATYSHTESVSDDEIEEEIQAKGLNAPRITSDYIEANIVSEHYFTAFDGRSGAIAAETYSGREKPKSNGADLAPLKLLTFCVLVLRNDFTVTGESTCVSSENFDAEIGCKIARQNAVNKVWQLEGYLLQQRLYEALNGEDRRYRCGICSTNFDKKPDVCPTGMTLCNEALQKAN